MTSTIKVNQLSYSYPLSDFQKGQDSLREILHGITFEVSEGEILGILGPNGGGKSTLLKLLAGLLTPTSGLIEFSSQSMKKGIIYIPQKDQRNLSYPKTIREFLESARLPLEKVNLEECMEALEKVDLQRPIDQPLYGLSGGEYQRVLLAKAYIQKSRIILMDEPTKGLDGIGQDKLLELLSELKRKAAIILVDHNIAQVLKHCDRLLCLNKNYHWHDHRSQINKDILQHTYHCEFEHLMIHEQAEDILEHEHHACALEHHPHQHSEKEKEGKKS
jgi:zinc transport system ATP-binding protein